ncbi:hypothetical protein H9P43_004013 [Blastocladiella emersonii ATCC 22665]|nr:hypothetical protein H9P43_004013 [Blastocladiella emersonii ATCC 22665]
MAPVLSTLRPRTVLGVAGLALTIYVNYARRTMHNLDPSDAAAGGSGSAAERKNRAANGRASGNSANRVGVNARFIAQMKRLLPILVPSPVSREAGLLAALAAVLFARTWLDVWFSSLNSSVVHSIVSRNKRGFIGKAIIEFGTVMWVLSFVNNSLKLCISNLSLAFRKRLTRYAHDQYLNGLTFYKAANIDSRLQNIDQLLTQDIEKLCDSASTLIGDLAKPVIDIGLFGYKLGQAIGKESPIFMISYFLFSGVVLRSLSPPFGKYTAVEQRLEGDYRFTHSRIIAHNEEIAFYGGADREKTLVNASFDRIVRHASRVINLKFANGIIDSVFVKYLATMLAYYLLARPVFDPAHASPLMGGSADPTKIMEDYSRNSSYLVNLSQAVGRIILAGRDLTRFAGYTSRVAELFDVLDDLNNGRYQSTMVSGDEKQTGKSKVIDSKVLGGEVEIQDGVIAFDKVPLMTPNGDVLVKELSFRIQAGQNTLLTGPNGAGKSSAFRVLCDLWPLFGGKVTKPHGNNSVFFVPQKPYLALGTLRDQVIYPDTREQALAKGLTDEKLLEILDVVRLKYLVSREGGWDSVQDWGSALSGGEKQRVAMARLFYHRPAFAVLDESTSATSMDAEGIMYEHARELGITLFTVSHRTSLFKYHDFLLKFDGEGGYEFTPLDHSGEVNPFAFGHGKSQYAAKEAVRGEDEDESAADDEASA